MEPRRRLHLRPSTRDLGSNLQIRSLSRVALFWVAGRLARNQHHRRYLVSLLVGYSLLPSASFSASVAAGGIRGPDFLCSQRIFDHDAVVARTRPIRRDFVARLLYATRIADLAAVLRGSDSLHLRRMEV